MYRLRFFIAKVFSVQRNSCVRARPRPFGILANKNNFTNNKKFLLWVELNETILRFTAAAVASSQNRIFLKARFICALLRQSSFGVFLEVWIDRQSQNLWKFSSKNISTKIEIAMTFLFNYILQKYLHYSIQIIIRMMKKRAIFSNQITRKRLRVIIQKQVNKKNFEKFLASKKTFRVWQWLTASGATFRAKRLERSDWGMHRCRSIMRFWIHLRKFTKRVWTWELIEEPLFWCFLFVVGCQHRCRSINKKQISLFGLTFDLCKSVVWVSRLCVSSLELKTPQKKSLISPKIVPQNISYRG